MHLPAGELGERPELHVRAREGLPLMGLDSDTPGFGNRHAEQEQPAHVSHPIRRLDASRGLGRGAKKQRMP